MNDRAPIPTSCSPACRQQEAARAARAVCASSSAPRPGVGKTYAMLAARATAARQTGIDVVVGIVETHGRERDRGAARRARGPAAARRSRYRGRMLHRVRPRRALARRPALILVDELAHTNAPGSRHPKRWQDVEELLAAGIDVYTTLNVQHLESLNDVVGGITGIRVRETVPDTFFDEADEVVLVDLPADELLARLKAGKVYCPSRPSAPRRTSSARAT